MTVPVLDSIATLLDDDPRPLDNDELKARVRDLVAAQARVQAAVLAAVVEFDHRNLAVTDGQTDTRAWIAHHTGTARKTAGATIWLAKRIRYMPAFHTAMADGAITAQHARVMATAINPRTLDAYVRDETMLVGHAIHLEVDDFVHAVARWVFLADPDGPDPGTEKPSRLHVSPMLDGRHRVDGELDLHDSVEFLAELEARYDELWHEDHSDTATETERNRTRSQRYAAAAVEMARRSSAATDEGPAARKPQIIAIVDVPALEGDPEGLAELDDGTPVTQQLLSQWLCDCTLARVVLAGRSIVLDSGFLIYTPSPGQRRALTARDRGCIVPGCRRKARWCQAHHVNPFPNGPTNLNNLVLLCHRHHKHVHRKLITITQGPVPGTFTITRPDGTQLYERPPPNQLIA